jgi:hypothetical protein
MSAPRSNPRFASGEAILRLCLNGIVKQPSGKGAADRMAAIAALGHQLGFERAIT